jgi:hypothetical protein
MVVTPRDLAGTSLEGTVVVDVAAVQEVLRRSVPAGLEVEFRPDNRLLVRYGMFHAQASLPPALDVGDAPQLTVTLASILVALGLKAMLHQPFLHVHGRHVTVRLAEVPALAPWRAFLPFLRRAEIASDARRVRVRFSVRVEPRALESV